MTAIPCRFLAASLRPTPVGAPPASVAGPESQWIPKARELLDRLEPLAVARYLIACFIGIAAAIGWQSYAGPAGTAFASAATPDQQQLNAILLDTMRRNIDQIVANIANIEEQMTRGVGRLGAGQEQLAASQDQMTREIVRLQAVLSKSTEPPPRAAPAPAPAPVQRTSQAPVQADARSDWRRQPCCQWPASNTR